MQGQDRRIRSWLRHRAGPGQTDQQQTGQDQTSGWQELMRRREAGVHRDGDGSITAAAGWVEAFHQLDR